MKAELTWLEGVYFEAEAGGHKIRLEGAAEGGGLDRAIRPMHSILIGLASCSAYDVVTILKKGKQKITGCKVEVTAKRSDDIPAVFTHIALHFNLSGDGLQEKRVATAVELSVDKYCSVAKMLRQAGVDISYSYEIQP